MELDSSNMNGMTHSECTKLSDHAVSELNIMKYAEARAQEIDAMDSVAQKSIRNRITTQSVPVHMRRRAASHNIKRLPKRLRDKAIHKMKDGPPKKPKRPSRKHRRRPSNLLQEYNRRKKAFMWLETHIWHAKRFHMQKQWGYHVANFPNDKSSRACYRASVRHSLMWDMSYLACLQINGPETEILTGFQKISSTDTGPGIGSVGYLSGSMEGTSFLYQSNRYPRGAIGPVTFLWKPIGLSAEINVNRTLWLWVHPLTFSEILQELRGVFSAVQVFATQASSLLKDPTNQEIMMDGKRKSSSQKAEKIMRDVRLNKKYPDTDVVCYKGLSVEIISLKDALCRFRLMGPESLPILTDVLQTADVSNESSKSYIEGKQAFWWDDFFSNKRARNIHLQQASAWTQIAQLPSGLYLPPHTVLGLTVKDPRLRIPQKRTKVTFVPHTEDTEKKKHTSDRKDQTFQWPDVSYSPLWEEYVRTHVKATKLSEQEINARRAENLIPGQPLDLGSEESRVPVLLIQRPGKIQDNDPLQEHWSMGLDGQGSGWDLILPSGWAMAFWIALVYRGARVGGVRELINSDFELGQIHFPDYSPDTAAGKLVAEITRAELEATYKRKPPAKRPNYHNLGVVAPFNCPWVNLIRSQCNGAKLKTESQENTELTECKPYILRSKSKLQILHTLLNSFTDVSLTNKTNENLLSACQDSQSCLVAVQVTMLSRGTCASFALIHFPSETDLSRLATDSNYEGPVEKIHQEFKSGLIATNVKSVREKEELQSSRALQPDREVCGYICDGGFSLHQGKGAGLGYVTLQSLCRLIQMYVDRKPLILIRCPTSRQYRFSHVSVLSHCRLVQL